MELRPYEDIANEPRQNEKLPCKQGFGIALSEDHYRGLYHPFTVFPNFRKQPDNQGHLAKFWNGGKTTWSNENYCQSLNIRSESILVNAFDSFSYRQFHEPQPNFLQIIYIIATQYLMAYGVTAIDSDPNFAGPQPVPKLQPLILPGKCGVLAPQDCICPKVSTVFPLSRFLSRSPFETFCAPDYLHL